ncbi:sodium pump decarboxylase gamma subunit [Intestinibacillus massiliensis]|nr:sodium pump decarboxylase gamma subunit [Intestinibacillus massiliensis]MCB6364709.1 sodium pump decarboxylase gamma subunit [Intestinibacillus massiliensis]
MLTEQVLQNLMQAATMMWQGMLGIFVVIGLIALIVYLLSKTGGTA